MAESNSTGVFVDGVSNRRRTVQVRIGINLDMLEGDQVIASWPWDSIRKADAARDELRLRSVEGPELARLNVADPQVSKTIVSYSPSLLKGTAGGRTSTPKIVAWSIAAAVSILFVGLVGVPYAADRLAPLLPYSVENRIGDMVDRQVKAVFGSKTCDDPAGKKAYLSLVTKITKAGNIKIPLHAAVLNSSVKNAIALPGGRIYFFRGLLREARNPDEFAGVLAHEIGHVHHRDGLRKLLQAGGTSYLLGLLFGDVTGAGAVIFAGRVLLDKAYTRTAEYRADGFAIEVFKKFGRSPAPMGELLLRITGKQGSKKSTILASHPFSEDRLKRMKEAVPVSTGEPLLSTVEWNALKGICANLPAAKQFPKK